ncbi:C-type lectin domain family 6 member A-like isoform X2 [Lepisosteus oculatus]|uniref:C-type lectin domain family 6 member A-like isoform X2 n=1 Tax=Lepisosteus oculatus TaxID=7918 RepID=UPI000740060E|nr:PREDICTED: C-type lectin domain family 6 member A-like isoform X2 [Lepisosteus oculatus]
MDRDDGYNKFHNTELETSYHGNSLFSHAGKRWPCLLHTTLLMLLLVLLLLTGLKFSLVQQEVAEVKLLLLGMNSSKAEPQGATLKQTAGLAVSYTEGGDCGEGWIQFKMSCYLMATQKNSWHDAQTACVQERAHLVVINTAEEQDFFSEQVDIAVRQVFWIGLHDRSEESKWEWVDGTDFSSTPHFWDLGQPDNWQYSNLGEDCVQLHRYAIEPGRWNDANCDLRFRYICERERK